MSDKKRINQIAKETGMSNMDLVNAAQALGMEVKSHSSSVSEDDAKKIVAKASQGGVKTAPAKQAPAKKNVKKEPVAPARTFAGKAIVEDPAILARIKAKEEADKAAKLAKATATEAPAQAVAKPVVKEAPKAQTAAPKTETKPVAAAEKNEKSESKIVAKNETAKNDQPKFGKKPRIQIKVVKRAEDIKKEAEAAADKRKAEHKSFDRNRNHDNRRNNDNRRPQNKDGQGHFDKKRPQGQQGQGHNKFDKPASTTETFAAPVTGKTSRRDRDKKKTEHDNNGDGNRKGGPLHVNDNRNQVRNARNSNWNSGKQRGRGRNNKFTQQSVPATQRKFHELPESLEYQVGMNVQDIAKSIKREPAEIIKKLFMMGTMVNQNQSLDEETIELILMDYGIEAVKKVEEDKTDIERLFVEEGYLKEENMVERAPVVTIMGHVDHGKTTLLDHLRNSHVTEGEAGGITQAIGAYQITTKGKKITFLDTPGHEAFTSMRARGASVTDITILVVAADDGVMPQTIEAIDHSKAANVPIIVAVNKIDKPGANPARVMQELAEHGVISTAWGGESEFVEISAKYDKNLDELLETVLLVAEVQELKADPTVRAIGTVIEARLDQGKGAIATLLVQQGTMHIQDPIVVGNTYGRVRTMVNERGRRVKEAGPSTPVELTGLNDMPQAGDHFAVFEDEKTARSVGEERAKHAQLEKRKNTRRVSLDNLFDTLKEGQTKTVNIIIKADVQGSAEALAASLQKIEVEGVKVDIVHAAAGAISESDVALAEASNAIIVGFNVRPTGIAREQAERADVDIRLHNIIYKVIEEVETAMRGMLDPEYKEEITGEAIVREVFTVSKVGTIAGFLVTRGKVSRDASVRVIREGVVLFDGTIASLKHFKDDVKEVGNAQEGGLMIDGYNDIAVDDTLEVYKMVEIERK
ncbi:MULTISPECIES: translation initiation factor IF-2 [unclassified Lactococcus]|uniref:translation initiation factor IF-2 n=1 Tax=unclassified Lactococcus TaxID=2643510 RepID=UPI0011C8AFF8|nr:MULTISPECIES: translation initiation factor IF-2 [unclassified Lactococcus]MQW22271.1 translation initiation factor IF-2 [Lactococcus sp. dk101]TXK45201.1 translation initiation factor IF-2 [Lactococcus sp. dk310]TXK51021.1 translation initiation factor IF-2 [Lactococcus sp. dk322]